MFVLTADESKFLRSKFSSLEHGGKGRHSKYNYKAFTEKGLYMLATVLKSRRATEVTFAIIETFAIAWRRGFQPRPLPRRWSFQLRHNGAARRRTSLRRHLLQYVTWRAVGGSATFRVFCGIPNLPRKPPRNLSLHFLLRQAYTVKHIRKCQTLLSMKFLFDFP